MRNPLNYSAIIDGILRYTQNDKGYYTDLFALYPGLEYASPSEIIIDFTGQAFQAFNNNITAQWPIISDRPRPMSRKTSEKGG